MILLELIKWNDIKEWKELTKTPLWQDSCHP